MKHTRSQSLALWMNGIFVGTWRMQPGVGETLEYDAAWVGLPNGRPISNSLPFVPGNPPQHGAEVKNYFENLLPDSKAIRERVARRFQASSTDAFALLSEVGRDCVGALQILPTAVTPDPVHGVDATPMNDDDVAVALRNALSPVPQDDQGDDDFRISIAGAQEKSALLWFGDRWCRPHGSTATSHIIKLPMGLVGNLPFDMSDSVENEWLCSEIMHAYGLPVARTQILTFGGMKVLAVERFDRVWRETQAGEPWLMRLPQEDMCQATGTPPHLKYEADGGPGMREIMGLLGSSLQPARDRRRFFQAQIIFWMLRATDGHAKNFSIFLRAGGAFELAPLYDVLSAWPFIGTGANMLSPFKARMAMAVRSRNAHWKMNDILRRHWLRFGAEHGVVDPSGRSEAFVVDDLIERTPAVIRTVRALLPEGFPDRVAQRILGGLQDAAQKLAG